MKRQYYIIYGNFANQYKLRYCDSKEDMRRLQGVYDNAERITREEAIKYARNERSRRLNDYAFSGYADIAVFPVYSDDLIYPENADIDYYFDAKNLIAE